MGGVHTVVHSRSVRAWDLTLEITYWCKYMGVVLDPSLVWTVWCYCT